MKKNKQSKNRLSKFFGTDALKIAPEIKQTIISSIMFLIAVIVILSFWGQAGVVGVEFQKIIGRLIGDSKIFIPLFFVLLGLVVLRGSLKKHLFALILGALFFIKGFSTIFYALENREARGGIIGSFIFTILQRLFDIWVAWLVAVALILIGVLIIYKDVRLDKPVFSLLKLLCKKIAVIFVKIFHFFQKIFSAVKFLRKNKREQKEKKSANIINTINNRDVDIKEDKISDLQPNKESTLLVKEGVQKKKKREIIIENFDLSLFEVDIQESIPQDIDKNLNIIKETLRSFSIPVEMKEVNIGPTVTQYTLQPSQGIKLSKIVSLSNDLALALASLDVIIEAPIPGKDLIGVQIPNRIRAVVRAGPLFESLFATRSFFSSLTVAIGRDVVNNALFLDLEKMPHLLIAGMTGSGKTVCLNGLIVSLIIKNSPDELRVILMDFKKVELVTYKDIPHLIGEVICDIHQASKVFDWLIKEMEDRFYLLQKMQVKDIITYNKKAVNENSKILPYIVVAIDELADLIMTKGKEVEIKIVRLCQLGRAAGIHLILSTQRPSVEVITGLIKANIAARIALTVASNVDSRTILDLSGAEKLLGNGDMLYITPQLLKPKRAQGVYISEEEIKKVTLFVKNSKLYELSEEDYLSDCLSKTITEEKQKDDSYYSSIDRDPLYTEAVELVVRTKKASASLLQRHLKIGYARAARLIDILEREGIVGPGEGAKPRQVFGVEDKK